MLQAPPLGSQILACIPFPNKAPFVLYNVHALISVVFPTRLQKQPSEDGLLFEREAFLGHHGGPIEGPLKPPVHYNTIVLRSLRGPLI